MIADDSDEDKGNMPLNLLQRSLWESHQEGVNQIFECCRILILMSVYLIVIQQDCTR